MSWIMCFCTIGGNTWFQTFDYQEIEGNKKKHITCFSGVKVILEGGKAWKLHKTEVIDTEDVEN